MELDLNNANVLVGLITKRSSAHVKVASVEVHRKPSPVAPVKKSRRDATEMPASKYQRFHIW